MFWFFIACFLLKHYWAQVKRFKKILPFQDDFSYEKEKKKNLFSSFPIHWLVELQT